VLDDTIAAIRSGNPSTVYSGIAQGLSQIDVAMSRLSDARGLAGELLNRADRIQSDLDTRGTQLEAQRSSAEDLDMIKGISDFQNQNTSYQAALQSYAQVQKLSLLNYLG
jgi:Flagellin and related hook-associated proteins